ncbi:DUF2145 domain-containing protein [uncultured Roseobacter sp.]|uniref:DUF2145 domain-containing protein n=1 Tax=uncultured Roseobacter sp. TaxID=114847 RepID=UPI002619C7E4|nr:DUF2145 domain-containing protein [uncultured Roseobacter sp.]
MKRIFCAAMIMLMAMLPTLTRAGSTQDTNPMLNAGEVAAFSTDVQNVLAARGAHVAIVGRVGRDPETLPEGIRYTHVAYWVYSQMLRDDGTTYKGYRVYNLYQQGDDGRTSRLIQDSPEDFFAGVYELDAGIIIPDKRLQKKLLNVIASPTYAQLHNPSYSVLANPTTAQFQNCTEHTLDVLMASLYDTTSTTLIKANIAAYFDPQPIKIGGIKRILAPAASPALTTVDHSGTVATATFSSIARFMREHDLDASIYRQSPSGAVSYLN